MHVTATCCLLIYRVSLSYFGGTVYILILLCSLYRDIGPALRLFILDLR